MTQKIPILQLQLLPLANVITLSRALFFSPVLGYVFLILYVWSSVLEDEVFLQVVAFYFSCSSTENDDWCLSNRMIPISYDLMSYTWVRYQIPPCIIKISKLHIWRWHFCRRLKLTCHVMRLCQRIIEHRLKGRDSFWQESIWFCSCQIPIYLSGLVKRYDWS